MNLALIDSGIFPGTNEDVTLETLTLAQAAERLGVHYMTAYRWVRLGLLPAAREDAEYRVAVRDADRFAAERRRRQDTPAGGRGGRRRNWGALSDRFAELLRRGDATGARRLVEEMISNTAKPREILVKVVPAALRRIGDEWAAGDLSVAEEHRASEIARDVVALVGARLAPPGRKAGAVVVATPPGERHDIGTAIAAALLREGRFDVNLLGGDTPVADLVGFAGRTGADAVILAVTWPEALPAFGASVHALHGLTPAPVVLAAGAAFASEEAALSLGADGYLADLDCVAAVRARITESRRRS